MRTSRFASTVAVVTLTFLGAIPELTAAADSSARTPRGIGTNADFNGDGYADLAVGANLEAVGSVGGAGSVNVIYGSAGGLSATAVPDQIWDQDSTNVEGVAEDSDRFGETLAPGDFNGDGYADLAVGVPGEDVGSLMDAGAVNVLYGSPSGLSATFVLDQLFDEDSPGFPGSAEAMVGFGEALAAGDFDGDGFADLAVAIPFKTVGSAAGAGVVDVISGSSAGLGTEVQQWSQDSPGVLEVAEQGDTFGWALATGDFDADGTDDLAVGMPTEDVRLIEDAGAASVLYGSTASGLTADGDQFLHQNITGVEDKAEIDDGYGYALATGDFDGDGTDDLGAGVPYEDVGTVENAGAVSVLYGSATGITTANDDLWSQDSSGIVGGGETADEFGRALATGDFGNGSPDDLAVAVPREDIGSPVVVEAGAVNVIYSTAVGGLTSAGNQLWTQDSTGIADQAEENDEFANTLTAGDFDADGEAELVAGTRWEDLESSGVVDCGTVNVIPGSNTGLTEVGDKRWTQDTNNVEGVAESDDSLGASVASA